MSPDDRTGRALVAAQALQRGDWWGCSWEVDAIRKRGCGGGGGRCDTSEAT